MHEGKLVFAQELRCLHHHLAAQFFRCKKPVDQRRRHSHVVAKVNSFVLEPLTDHTKVGVLMEEVATGTGGEVAAGHLVLLLLRFLNLQKTPRFLPNGPPVACSTIPTMGGRHILL
jgi:hypothetical protein